MTEKDWLAERFEDNRSHLTSVAYRMLGSPAEADDAVQETWLRLSRADRSDVENLRGWLTTTVARVCLDILRSRRAHHMEPLDEAEPVAHDGTPENDAILADSVGLALLVVLDQLDPAERLAFVLHDMFAVPFEEIAPIVQRSPAAARQLASRARRRVQGAEAPDDRARQRELVDAFLAASREGDFEALFAVLDPDVVVRADAAAAAMGADAEIRGADAVTKSFAGRAKAARPAMVGGEPGLVWAQGGVARVAFVFKVARGKIVEIEMVADPERIESLNVAY
ncbi:MAG TPA: sigma-70 family RNA polymerase sigma factor [Actinomycetota bacterium]|nr:sigma-70 family RNA polymerase sigma factor [Actinomycetota bacterium]